MHKLLQKIQNIQRGGMNSASADGEGKAHAKKA